MQTNHSLQPVGAHSSPLEVRHAIRRGDWRGHTSGLAAPNVQANLAILPERHAADFLLFCQRNPKPCPVLAVSDPGNPTLPGLGLDLDVRTDVSKYAVYENGKLTAQPSSIEDIWQDDWVTFAIGCSFSFEQALIAAGIPLRHVAQKKNVAMYRTSIATSPAGPFHGPMVVSMRPMKASDVIRAIQITSQFPSVHGAPVHLGDPALIGISDITKPDWGDPVDIQADEIPVFWACGVTPQAVLLSAKLPIAVTHSAGCMLVTDCLNVQQAFN